MLQPPEHPPPPATPLQLMSNSASSLSETGALAMLHNNNILLTGEDHLRLEGTNAIKQVVRGTSNSRAPCNIFHTLAHGQL